MTSNYETVPESERATSFFVSLVEGAEEAAEDLDVRLDVRYANDDAELQHSQIESLVDQGVNALLVNPVSDAVVPAIEAATAAGIAVLSAYQPLKVSELKWVGRLPHSDPADHTTRRTGRGHA
jgi:ABC-type sugar transport system substrate-binding protein